MTSPSLCPPPPPEFYKELAWVPEAQRKHTGRDASSLCPASAAAFARPACPCRPRLLSFSQEGA